MIHSDSPMIDTDRLKSLNSMLNEYKNNPHHIDPISNSFRRLIDEVQEELSRLSKANGDKDE